MGLKQPAEMSGHSLVTPENSGLLSSLMKSVSGCVPETDFYVMLSGQGKMGKQAG